MHKVIAEDFTLVTHNARDFKGASEGPDKGLPAREGLHAGLVCLNACEPMDLDRQARLFRIALEEVSQLGDLVNQALEITESGDGSIDIDLYSIP